MATQHLHISCVPSFLSFFYRGETKRYSQLCSIYRRITVQIKQKNQNKKRVKRESAHAGYHPLWDSLKRRGTLAAAILPRFSFSYPHEYKIKTEYRELSLSQLNHLIADCISFHHIWLFQLFVLPFSLSRNLKKTNKKNGRKISKKERKIRHLPFYFYFF